ncbi:rhodanese-like domain-containing protein [Sanguibacter antarcticus]|uniref:Rhodanese-related sulfurtransferase n=1 Tax=Sanguibacter antarcticus TaxID=372484 RepID=A0A2A9E962_9MICO|nr:rhodanese-like domain-containing protein [Sanguibacter antarcticus]PFG35071.1 rhodanese-related sulfurtransferase [Sanguibacter antarcticus]
MTYAGDLTPQQAWDLLRDDPRAVIVDVRTEAEWRQIGVPDVSELDGRDVTFVEWATATGPNEDFVAQVAEKTGLQPGDDRPIAFLCRSGNRSIGAASDATAAGYGPAYNILEGFEGDVDANGRRTINGWLLRDLPSTTYTGTE